MELFKAGSFDIPKLIGISEKNIEEHIKLYQGYVKHANLILEKIEEYSADSEKNAYVLAELQRRFAFEHDGIRNHETFFKQFVGGPKELPGGPLKEKIEKDFGSFETFLARIKAIALTRGVGWLMVYHCSDVDHILTQWVDEQHIGHLNGPKCILALDMWEHAFVYDYPTSEKKKYVDVFFENLNWDVIEKRFLRM